MTRKLFGTDGIRGKANTGVMTPETAFRLGAALTYRSLETRSHVPHVVIGKDTRISGYLFETALAAGVCSMGGSVLLSGPLPTPAIAHLTQSMRADVGVVISASHNSFEDNGIKVFGRDGFKLPDSAELELERLMEDPALATKRATGTAIGRAERLEDAWGRYVAFVKATFPKDLDLEGIRVVVDAAHGAAYRAAPAVFQELGARVTALGIQPNGENINMNCGATAPRACAEAVVASRADIGVALDGDADRVIVIDEKGNAIDGDVIMALCAARMLREDRLRHRTVVATVMSNLGLERAVEGLGGKLERCAVGDRYVVEAMRRGGYNFGGEASGHMVFLDETTTGDGLIAALQIAAILVREQRPLSELSAEALERVPQVLINVRCATKRPLAEMQRTTHRIEESVRVLANRGRVLVRWSGTEAKLRVMVEGDSAEDVQKIAEDIAACAKEELG